MRQRRRGTEVFIGTAGGSGVKELSPVQRDHSRTNPYSHESSAICFFFASHRQENWLRATVLRLQHLTRLRMNLLIFNLAGIPPAAERFHQINGTDHLLTQQLRLQPFAGQ